MNRRIIGWLAGALLLALVGSAAAQTTDVPPEHWAYQAVLRLVERGYMDVDADGAFRGGEGALRYDVAAAVGRLLLDIEDGKIDIGAGLDTEMLRALEQEFRAELVQWYAERDRLEAAHGQTQRHIAAIDEQIGLLLIALDDVHTSLRAELTAGLAEEAERTDARFAQGDAAWEERFQRVDELFAEAAARVDVLAGAIDDEIAALRRFVDETFAQRGEAFGARFDDQRRALDALAADVDGLRTTLDRRGEDLDDLDLRLNNYIHDQAAALAMRLAMTESSLRELVDDVAELSSAFAATQRTTDAEIRTLLDAADELVAALDGQGARLADLASGLRTDLDDLRADVAALQRDGEALAAGVAELRGEADGLREEADGLRQDVDSVAAEGEATRIGLSRLREEVEGLQGEAADLFAAVDGLESEAAALRFDIARLLTKTDELDAGTETLRRETRDLDGRTGALRNDVDGLHVATDRLAEIAAALGGETEALRVALGDGLARLQEEDEALRRALADVREEMLLGLAGAGDRLDGLLSDVESLRERFDGLRGDVVGMQAKLGELEEILGSSEDHVARMTERVRMQLDDQLALSLSRERQLERQLNELRTEFEGYKAQAEEEMKSARSMGTMALGVAALAVLLGLMN